MSVIDSLSRLFAGAEAVTPREATAALVQAYSDCVWRAVQLERHAEMAPQPHSEQVLRRLAAEDVAQGVRLRQAIEAAGAFPTPTAEPSPRTGLNHWERLLQDLDAHRRCVLQSRELALRFAARLPQTAALFDTLCRTEGEHCEGLRALIARADPQALD
jgi:hypothetical protein